MIAEHAKTQIKNRFETIITNDVITHIEKRIDAYATEPKLYIEIVKYKNVRRFTESNGHECCGDVLVAVVKLGCIVTFLLGNSRRNDYFSDGKYIRL